MNNTTLRRHAATLLHYAGLVLLVSALLLVLVVNVPQVIGADQSYVVLSDSMEPAYSAGDVVIVKSVSPENINEGDVVTFDWSNAADGRVTHRVIGVEQREQQLYFETKGDANEDADPQAVPASQVVGRVWFGIPHIGYGLWFARSKAGIALLVIVPAGLLILAEAWDLLKAVRASSGTETGPDSGDAPADQAPNHVEGE